MIRVLSVVMDSEKIKEEIRTMLDKMSFAQDIEEIEAHHGATSRYSVRLQNDTNLLIGEYGDTLSALEYILKRIIRKKFLADPAQEPEAYKFTLDINDYRLKRLEDLKQDVKTAAREVRLYRKEVPLRPMSSFERRIVHLLLAEYPDITTESIGREPERRVVIKPYP